MQKCLTKPNNNIRAVYCPHPFSVQRNEVAIEPGGSVQDILTDLDIFPLVAGINAHVFIDDEYIEFKDWAAAWPADGQTITIRVVPMGGGGGGRKNILRTVLTIAVVAFAAWAGPIAAGALGFGSAAAGAIATAGISIVGQMLVNALIPPPRPNMSALSGISGGATTSPTLSITGTRNKANPYGPVPRIYGRYKVFPPYGAVPYTEIIGSEQYLRLLFAVGYGPLNMSDLKIGETPIDYFDDVEYEVRQGYTSDDPITLYTNDIHEEPQSILLTRENGPHTRRTITDIDEISIDVQMPRGLVYIESGGSFTKLVVEFALSYKEVNETSWTEKKYKIIDATTATLRFGIRIPVDQGQYDVRLEKMRIRFTEWTTAPIGTAASMEAETETGLQEIEDFSDKNIAAANTQYVHTLGWSMLRSIKYVDPISAQGIATVAIRIKATDQLNGIIDQFNCIAHSILEQWTGTEFIALPSSNPAWAYLNVLNGTANALALDNSRIELDDIKGWADWCDQEEMSFNGVIDFRTTVYGAAQDIAPVGRASFGMVDGNYSVVRDMEQAVPIQHFTPRNSWGFKGTKVFRDIPHAFKAKFVNPEKGWQQDEAIVYDDGYNADGSGGLTQATKFETFELWGVTNYDQAWKMARYNIAVARLRPEVYELNADIEHIVCTRGDKVLVTHDVPFWGLGFARVKSVAVEGTGAAKKYVVTIDDQVQMITGTDYTARIRFQDGDSATWQVETDDTATDTIKFLSADGTRMPLDGDLFMFGELDNETVELLVKSILPAQGLTARLTLVDYAPAVHQADQGTIPEFDSQMTIPEEIRLGYPPVPVIDGVRSDDEIMRIDRNGRKHRRILLNLSTPNSKTMAGVEKIEVQVKRSDSSEWEQAALVGGDVTAVYVEGVEEGQSYDIRARAISFLGVASEWARRDGHIIGTVEVIPPADIEFFILDGNRQLVRWIYDDAPSDLAGFELRQNIGNNRFWDTAMPLHEGLIGETQFNVSNIPGGLQTLLLKAVDAAGQKSDTAAVLVLNLGDPLDVDQAQNIIYSDDYKAAGFPGTVIDGALDAGNLCADAATDIFWTGAGGSVFWDDDDSGFWHGNFWFGDDNAFWDKDASVYWVTRYKEMTYMAEIIPPTDMIGTTLILDRAITAASHRVDFLTDETFLMWESDPTLDWWHTDPTLMWQALGDNFIYWPNSMEKIKRQKYFFRTTTQGGRVRGCITGYEFKFDAPNINEYFNDVNIFVGGSRLTPVRNYRKIKNVSLTLQDDGGTAQSLKVIDKNNVTGPLVKSYTGAGAETTALIDAVIQGY